MRLPVLLLVLVLAVLLAGGFYAYGDPAPTRVPEIELRVVTEGDGGRATQPRRVRQDGNGKDDGGGSGGGSGGAGATPVPAPAPKPAGSFDDDDGEGDDDSASGGGAS
ncbi:MAG TPA: hypothetical protein VD704_01710 [Gaiellaceae bacterium]|nr:hypothetical protein [Gaiellaceae bacterium]